jgi:DNA-binding MarR family transcriptional regulator
MTMIDKLLQESYSKFSKAKGHHYSPQGLTPQQISILMFLDQNGSMKVSDIASGLKMVDSNVSNICTRLEKSGFVKRDRLKDNQRIVIIELTGEAVLKMNEIKASVSELVQKVNECISQHDLELICAGLAKLNTLLDVLLEESHERKRYP